MVVILSAFNKEKALVWAFSVIIQLKNSRKFIWSSKINQIICCIYKVKSSYLPTLNILEAGVNRFW